MTFARGKPAGFGAKIVNSIVLNSGTPMKSVFALVLISLFCLATPLNLQGQSRVGAPDWDRATALQSVDRMDALDALKPLYQMARSGQNSDLITALSEIAADPRITAPQQDYLVYRFTIGLSDLDVGAVSPAVISYLSSYPARTLVAHDDHPGVAVPLFNVRSAAMGISNGWERKKAARNAELLAEQSVEQFMSSFQSASPAAQRGYIDALAYASTGQQADLSKAAIAQLEATPALTGVAAHAAIHSGDLELLRQSIEFGSGPDIAKALESASRQLDDSEAADLLARVMRVDSNSKAALAIAHLAPGRLDHPVVRDLMFDTLSDRNLGASAALVLADSQDPAILERLSEVAATDKGLQGQRATLALSSRSSAGRVDQ
jgi:hypothetical protein